MPSARDLDTASRGYTDDDLAEVDDHPEWTGEDLARATPFGEAHPELAAALRRTRGPQRSPTKMKVSMRLSRDVVEALKAAGSGWQARADDLLKKGLGIG